MSIAFEKWLLEDEKGRVGIMYKFDDLYQLQNFDCYCI